MSYEILSTAEGLSILHITNASIKSFTGWRVEFHDGKEAILYHQNDKWLQYDEHWLDEITLMAIGSCIDEGRVKKNLDKGERYFYDMLIN